MRGSEGIGSRGERMGMGPYVAVLDKVAHVGRNHVPRPAAAAHKLARAPNEFPLELGKAHLGRWPLQREVAHEERCARLGRDGIERGGGELGSGLVEEGEEFLDGRRVGARDEFCEGLDRCDRCWQGLCACSRGVSAACWSPFELELMRGVELTSSRSRSSP